MGIVVIGSYVGVGVIFYIGVEVVLYDITELL
jgi:hypothetical protein